MNIPETTFAFDDATPIGIMERAYALARTLLHGAAEHAARRLDPKGVAEILNDAMEQGLLKPETTAYIMKGIKPAEAPKAPPPEATPDSVPAGTRRH